MDQQPHPPALETTPCDQDSVRLLLMRGVRYPPVDTFDLMTRTRDLSAPRDNLMISFAQFRPEKDHALQLRVWSRVLPILEPDAMFYLVGSVRDPDDQRIVDDLKALADQLGISHRV